MNIKDVMSKSSTGLRVDSYKLKKQGWAYRAETYADIPDTPHWQMVVYDHNTPQAMYDNEPARKDFFWRIWVFKDKARWQKVAQAYFEDKANPERRVDVKAHFLECSGVVQPQVQVSLNYAPRG